jgi:hypothetical protein
MSDQPLSAVVFEVLPVLSDWEQQHPAEALERRRLDTVQACVFCGQQAQLAYIAHTMRPPRWMDVCHPHGEYLQHPSRATLDAP